MKYFIGVDLGGTNIRAAKVDELGQIIQVVKGSTEVEFGVDHVINKIVNMIKSIDGYQECVGIGMGVPGPVDTVNGVMTLATNLPGFVNFPMCKKIEEATGLKTYADNDVNVACLAESYHGAGKGHRTVYYVTISTGIGGAFTINHQLGSGAKGYAGEIANIVIDRNRDKVNYLNVGAVENEASGVAITRKGKLVFGDKIKHAGDVFDLAREKDPQALKIVDEMVYDLGLMFSIVGHVIDPDIFVVGGGCMKSKDVFFDRVIETYKGLVHVGMQDTEFKQAQLEEPGIIGAAMLPMSHLI